MTTTPRATAITDKILGRPILGALLVCTLINGVSLLSTLLLATNGLSYWLNHWQTAPLLTLIGTSTTFLIPWAIMRRGRRALFRREGELLAAFPEMNPDLVLKLSAAGKVDYFNNTTSAYLEKLAIPSSQPELILPANYLDLLTDLSERSAPLVAETRHQDISIEFAMRCLPGCQQVFVAGRDVSRQRRLERDLTETNAQLQLLTDFLDRTLAKYSPQDFNLQFYHKEILSNLLQNPAQPEPHKPQAIFLTSRNLPDNFSGHLYRREPDELWQGPLIDINPQTQDHAITKGMQGAYWQNWDEGNETLLDFQQQFHPEIRRHADVIHGFATYRSADIALIAFYRDHHVEKQDAMLLKSLAVVAAALHRIAKENRRAEDAFFYTIDALARASEANDEDTGDHIKRLNEYSKLLAEEMELEQDFINQIHYSAQMHDVGKIHVHPEVLKKPGKLTDAEFDLIKQHTFYGVKILGDSPHLQMAAEIALCHHEYYNGKGYPRGLKGEEIPLSARIVNLVDVYDALRQKRVYKPAFCHERSLQIITQGDGRTEPDQFDPRVRAAFLAREQEMADIFARLSATGPEET